jgi:anti-sigma factor RsiW
MSNCRGMRDRLGRYFDGELSDTERLKVDDHLKQCSRCRSDLQEIGEVAAIFREEMPVPSIPVNLTRRIMDKAQVEVANDLPGRGFLLFWRNWPLSMRFAALAVAVAACYIGIFLGSSSLTSIRQEGNEMKWVDMSSRGPIITAYEGGAR